ncbi:MAG: prolyl oligopeptidase family serine peptidase [Verrucomicrobiales bacterium]
MKHAPIFLLSATALVAGAVCASAEELVISTVAGTGSPGFAGDGGPAIEAQVNNPYGVIVSPDGDLVFCDIDNHAIRRVSRKTGTIDTIVGSGEMGYSGDGGPPLEAKANQPYEVRYHPSGDLYWVEMRNHVVRKLDARTNRVETVAGTGEAGFSGDGGPAVKAAFNQPHSIEFDQDGESLYVCDISNHRIRVVDLESGTVETWCGTGEPKATEDGAEVGPNTPLKGPRALALAPDGDLWLALREGNQVFRIDREEGRLFHVAGTGKKGFHSELRPAREALLSGPKGVAVSPDGSRVYLADTESHTIRAIHLETDPPVVTLVAGSGKRGDGPDAPDPLECAMDRPHGVGVDPVTGDLYIGDSEAHKVRKVSGLPGKPRAGLAEYPTEEFEVAGRRCKLTRPVEAAESRPWIWRCRFYGAFPSVDEALLSKGWHVAWIDVADLFGGPEAMDAFDEFHEFVTARYGVNPLPVMEGFSRGGLPAINWAIRHPDRVAGVYLDAPVLDIRSWPKSASNELWRKCLDAYGLTEADADGWIGPLARLETLARARVPIMVVAGGNDAVVPYRENAGILETRFGELGGDVSVVVKAGGGHHPHSLHDPAPVVEWAEKATGR